MHVARRGARVQEARYKKERAAYLRAKRKVESQAAGSGGGGGGKGKDRHAGHAALAGVREDKKANSGKPLKRPKKPELATVRAPPEGPELGRVG